MEPTMERSILTQRGIRSGASLIASGTKKKQTEFLNALDPHSLRALPYLFDFWAMPHQIPPLGAWRTWVILGGRGAGKTRAGAEWVRQEVEGARPTDPGQSVRLALIGETYDQSRDVMVFGESGILASSPPDRRPAWEAGRRRLVWPNGATAQLFSAHEPEALRGPQFDAAWIDELAKWPKAEDTWDMLQFALRIGPHPRQCVTTTPRNVPILKRLLDQPSTVSTHAPTEANRANLAKSFLEEVRARYAGSFLERQELDGILVEDVTGALWTLAGIEAARIETVPDLSRIVVAVDPPAKGQSTSDACGIVVAGVIAGGAPDTWRAVVLEDATVAGASPTFWAETAIAAMRRHKADRLVAEVNQGGDLVETVVRQVDPMVSYRAVHASRGKVVRAEPVAALYEQGRVHHVGVFRDLEDQMRLMARDGFHGRGSPDRVDALVWALTDLMIEPAARWQRPQVRTLG
ncbi:MAG: terminase family protein [Pseudomonadota bacterium]